MKRREAEFCRVQMRVGKQTGTSVLGQHSGWARAPAPCGDLPAPVTPSAAPSHPGSLAAGSITVPAIVAGYVPTPPSSTAPSAVSVVRVPRPIGAGSATRCDVEQLLGATQSPAAGGGGGAASYPCGLGPPARSQPTGREKKSSTVRVHQPSRR